jgi:FSR family fosmidomycin resistance protein-like MFS transporter
VLIVLTLAHGLVDTFAALVQPLWPDLQRGLALDESAIGWAYVLWGLATSVSQLAFGYWGDRDRGHWMLWAGPAVGVVCLSAVGLAPSFGGLCVLLFVGGLGIAAFHPEAAALAGSCAPKERSRAMSVFAVGGYLGQAAGPIYSGVVSTNFGLKALAWSMAWGFPLLALLVVRLDLDPPGQPDSPRDRGSTISLGALVHGKRRTVSMLLAIGTLRVLPALGVPLALAYTLKARGDSNELIGVIQAVFLGAIGAGNLGCALFIGRGIERRVLWLLPLAVAPVFWALPMAGPLALPACVAVAGLLLGSTMPILVSYGQQLLPDGQRVASSITMGVTWGLGGVLVALTMSCASRVHHPELAFSVFAAGCAVSSVLCAWLPDAHADRIPEGEIQPAS